MSQIEPETYKHGTDMTMAGGAAGREIMVERRGKKLVKAYV